MGKNAKKQANWSWFERNAIHPVAYGGDQAVNDWFGERGLARPVTQSMGFDPWQPTVEEPENFVPQVVSEIPRGILASGGLLGSARVLPMLAGGTLAGYARDPGPDRSLEDLVREPDPYQRQVASSAAQRRLNNAGFGLAGAAIGGVAGRGLGKGAEKLWIATIGRNAAKEAADYGAKNTAYAGAKRLHQMPEYFEKQLNQFPTAKGTYRRGVRPDHPTELQQINGLKEGDVYQPGRALSMDRFGRESANARAGRIDELDNTVKAAPKPGPYVYVKTRNARNIGDHNAVGWEEITTLPSSKFRVTKVVRNEQGEVTELYLTDMSRPDALRTASDVTKNTSEAAIRQMSRGTWDQKIEAAQKAKRAKEKAPQPVRQDAERAFNEHGY